MANKKSKLSRLENQILEARVYVKRGLYESFYVQYHTQIEVMKMKYVFIVQK
jgi:hypothetical protein